MTNSKLLVFLPLTAAMVVSLAAAQTTATTATSTTPQTSATATTHPGQRKENQQDRIGQGVTNGQLTAGESTSLETKEAKVNAETRTMRAQDNGHLTAADRSKLNRQQNRLSSQIHTDRHNGASQHYGHGTIGQRDAKQQNRIGQGIKSGSLTAGEAAHLEKQQQGTNREVGGMREANGGKLSGADKKIVQRQQNKNSRHIAAAKHNRRGH